MPIQRAGGQRPGATHRPPMLVQPSMLRQRHCTPTVTGGCRSLLSLVVRASDSNEAHCWVINSNFRLPQRRWWHFRSRAAWHHYDMARQPNLSFAMPGETGSRPVHVQLCESLQAAVAVSIETMQDWLEAILDILLTPLRMLLFNIKTVVAALTPSQQQPQEQQYASAARSTQTGRSIHAQRAQRSLTYPIDIEAVSHMHQHSPQQQPASTFTSYRQQLQGAFCSIGEAVQSSAPCQVLSSWSSAQQIGLSAVAVLLLAGPAWLKRWMADMDRQQEEQELIEANARSMAMQKQRFQAALGTVAASSKGVANSLAHSSSMRPAANASHSAAQHWDSEDEEEEHLPAMIRHANPRAAGKAAAHTGAAASPPSKASQRPADSRNNGAMSPTRADARQARSSGTNKGSFLDDSAAQQWQQFLSSSKALDVSELWDASSLSDATSLGAPAASKAQLEEITRRVRDASKGKDADKPIVTFDDLYGVPLQDKGAPLKSHRILDSTDSATESRNSTAPGGASHFGSEPLTGDKDNTNKRSIPPSMMEETMEERAARRKARFASQFADDADVAAMMGQAPARFRKPQQGPGGSKAAARPTQRAGSVLGNEQPRMRGVSVASREPSRRAGSTTPVPAHVDTDQQGTGKSADRQAGAQLAASAVDSSSGQRHLCSTTHTAAHGSNTVPPCTAKVSSEGTAVPRREDSPQPSNAPSPVLLPRNNVVRLKTGRPADRPCSLQPPLPAARASTSGQIAWGADRGTAAETAATQLPTAHGALHEQGSPQVPASSGDTGVAQHPAPQQQTVEGLGSSQLRQPPAASVLQQASERDAEQVRADQPPATQPIQPIANRLLNNGDGFGSRQARSAAVAADMHSARTSNSPEPAATVSHQPQQSGSSQSKLTAVRSPFGGVIIGRGAASPASTNAATTQAALGSPAAAAAGMPTAVSRAQQALAAESRGDVQHKVQQLPQEVESGVAGGQEEHQGASVQGEDCSALQRFMRRPTTNRPPA